MGHTRLKISILIHTLISFFAIVNLFAQNSLLSVEVDGIYGYLDNNGDTLISPQFDYAGEFSNGRAVFGIHGENYTKYGYINTHGEICIEAKYDGAGNFSEGLARIKVGKFRFFRDYYLWGFIDTTGQTIIKPKFENVADFHEGLAFFESSTTDFFCLERVNMVLLIKRVT